MKDLENKLPDSIKYIHSKGQLCITLPHTSIVCISTPVAGNWSVCYHEDRN